MFWVYMRIPVIFWVQSTLLGLKYTFKSQIHVGLHVLDRLKGFCNLLMPKNTLHFIF